MYLLIDTYGVVYKTDNINTTLEEIAEEGSITIIKVRDNDPKVFTDSGWLDIEVQG